MLKEMFRKGLLIFFGVDSPEEMKKKGLVLSAAVPAIKWVDWVLVGATATAVGFLKNQGFPEWGIFLILWVTNMALSASVVIAAEKTSLDLTLMEALRRLIDAAIEKSRVTGLMLESVVLIRLLLWDGADQFVIFLKRRIPNFRLLAVVFVMASAIQMAVWTVLYGLGYDNFSDLFRHLFFH
ncbi:MAG: hypothetical protein HGB37_00320 [Candidatus Moranbacteria bacterium]|jgi:hypothetical protein|nr:hypothetical protein [Candidatus Moranbacteria bacterium]